MSKRDFDAERAELNNQVEAFNKELTSLETKIKKIKAKRRAVNYELTTLTRDEQKAIKEEEKLKLQKAAGEQSPEEYAKANNLLMVDAKGVSDPFMKAMKLKYGVEFYSAYSFYDLASRLDEGCQLTAVNRKYFINEEVVTKVVERMSRLHRDELNELEKARLPKKGEMKTDWKKRFFTFVLNPPYDKLLSPQRKLEMEIWLKVDAVDRPH